MEQNEKPKRKTKNTNKTNIDNLRLGLSNINNPPYNVSDNLPLNDNDEIKEQEIKDKSKEKSKEQSIISPRVKKMPVEVLRTFSNPKLYSIFLYGDDELKVKIIADRICREKLIKYNIKLNG